MAGPRSYTDMTLKRLFGLSGNQCSFPGCTKTLVNIKNASDSCICHIEAANNGGERYNPNMSDMERADYQNLILLCPQHHTETNDVQKYTVEVLKKMKREHESQHLNERLGKNPSMLRNAIYAISEIDIEQNNDIPTLNIFDPKEKILYNELKENAEIIKEYRVYQSKLNSLYDELESQGSIKKEKLLENIKIIYTLIKGKYIQNSENSIDIIKSNSDNIFNDVFEKLCEELYGGNFYEEDICIGLRIIMVDAFMRCKILEEPNPENASKKQSNQTADVYDSK
jgi:hypothetical protein